MTTSVMTCLIGRLAAAIACVVFAGLLAMDEKAGWGWFIFAAIMLGSITVGNSKNDKDRDPK